ncbi:MAG: hypothetical protein U1E30_09645 [Rhodoblastus sp.]|jgi:hypothetical protein
MSVPEEVRAEFDTLRKAVLALEKLQRSPPEPIVLDIEEFAGALGSSRRGLELILARLTELRFIEGPGAYNDAWLFRRLTRRGRLFVEEVRSERRWEEIKRAYLQIANSGST